MEVVVPPKGLQWRPSVWRAVQRHRTLAPPREHQDHSTVTSKPALDEKKALKRLTHPDTTMRRLRGSNSLVWLLRTLQLCADSIGPNPLRSWSGTEHLTASTHSCELRIVAGKGPSLVGCTSAPPGPLYSAIRQPLARSSRSSPQKIVNCPQRRIAGSAAAD